MKLIKAGNQIINVERVNYWEWVETATSTKLVLYFSGKQDENWLELKGDKANEVHKWLERQAESICEEYSDNVLKAFWKLLKWLARLEQQETAKQMGGQQEPTAKSNGNGQTATTGVQHVKQVNLSSSR